MNRSAIVTPFMSFVLSIAMRGPQTQSTNNRGNPNQGRTSKLLESREEEEHEVGADALSESTCTVYGRKTATFRSQLTEAGQTCGFRRPTPTNHRVEWQPPQTWNPHLAMLERALSIKLMQIIPWNLCAHATFLGDLRAQIVLQGTEVFFHMFGTKWAAGVQRTHGTGGLGRHPQEVGVQSD